jgi:hypothetical protein
MKCIKNSLLPCLLGAFAGSLSAAELPTKKILTLDAAKQAAAAIATISLSHGGGQ